MMERLNNCFQKWVLQSVSTFALSLCLNTAQADQSRHVAYDGNFHFFSEIPETLFLMGPVERDSDFAFRKAIKRHRIKNLVLSSGGGSVDAGLRIAMATAEHGIRTYVPGNFSLPNEVDSIGLDECLSACTFIFFAGQERIARGAVGVHQIRTVFGDSIDDSTEAPLLATYGQAQVSTQATISKIISVLNQLEVPPFIYEFMFESLEFHYLDKEQLAKIETGVARKWHRQANQLLQELLIDLSGPTIVRNESRLTEKSKPKPTSPPLKRGEVWRAIQFGLNIHRCGAGNEDGVFGRTSFEALERFERQSGRSVTDLRDSPEALLSAVYDASFPACAGQAGPQGLLQSSWKSIFSCRGVYEKVGDAIAWTTSRPTTGVTTNWYFFNWDESTGGRAYGLVEEDSSGLKLNLLDNSVPLFSGTAQGAVINRNKVTFDAGEGCKLTLFRLRKN